MARRKTSIAETFVLLPWWVSASLAVISLFALPAIEAGLPPNPLSAAFKGALSFGRIIVPIAFCLFAALSAFRSWHVSRRLDAQSGLDSLWEIH